ncbi:MAG TPA: AMP-binding protein, partial [Acidimicrobiia bacterium]
MTSLAARLESGADGDGAVTFVGSAMGPDAGSERADRVSWNELHSDARAMATALQARGVTPGSHVALIGPTSRALVTALQATWLAGAAVVALPLPMRLGSIEEFVEQTRARIERAHAALVVIDAELAAFLDPPPRAPVLTLAALAADARRIGGDALETVRADPDRLAILQFTSGSTAEPKGVMLPDRCLLANIDAIARALGISGADRAVSWLPLYH